MTETTDQTAPRVFISYSWSSPDHETRVLDLATELREVGIDAVLDKWDLKEGQEANAFMEQMVSDPSIKKVIIISDRAYAEKSDKRQGGAGTEAQIITPQIYSKEREGKFVALVFERDEQGQACLPTYYTSRKYIDFTDDARRADNFDQLIRWIYDKPLHKKPELGKRPAYLDDGAHTITLATSAAHRRAMDALQNSRPHALAATLEFLETLTDQLPKFRITMKTDPLSEEIAENYSSFIPYRDQVVEVAKAVARLEPDIRYADAFHDFMERFLIHFEPSPDSGTYRKFDFDNYKFFAHELFLYLGTVAIQARNSVLFAGLTGRPYFDRARQARGGKAIGEFDVFDNRDGLLQYRNDRSEIQSEAPHVKLIKERTFGNSIRFEQLMQTDFVLFIRHDLHNDEQFRRWYPQTLKYLSFTAHAFEIFARARSKSELAVLLTFLGVDDRAALDDLVERYRNGRKRVPPFGDGWGEISVEDLMGYDELGTR